MKEPKFFNIESLELRPVGGSTKDTTKLSELTLSWAIDKVNDGYFLPVIGKKILPSSGDFVRRFASEQSVLYDIIISGDVNETIFTGYCVMNSLSSTMSDGLGNMSAMSNNINIIGKLARIAAYPPSTRVFRAAGLPAVLGPNDVNERPNILLSATNGLRVSAFLDPSMEGKISPTEYTVNLANALFNNYEMREDDLIKDLIKPSKDLMRDLFMGKGAGTNKTVQYIIQKSVANALVRQWANSNLLSIFDVMAQWFFLHLTPRTVSGTEYRLGPVMALGKAHQAELPATEVLGVQDNRKVSVSPITAVWVPRYFISTNNALNTQDRMGPLKSRSLARYFVYPKTDLTKTLPAGNALVKELPAWMNYFAFNYIQRSGDKNEGKELNKRGLMVVQSPQNIIKHKKETGFTQEDMDSLGELMAEAYYIENAFSKSTLTINTPWQNFTKHVLNIGKIYRIVIPERASGQEQEIIYFGRLDRVMISLSASPGRAVCSLTFNFVRDEKTNNELGIAEHPLYKTVTWE